MGKFFGSWDDLKKTTNRKSTRDLLEMFQETTSNNEHNHNTSSPAGTLRVKLLSFENLKEKAAEKLPVRKGSSDSAKKRGRMLRLARKWACLEPIVEEF